MDCCTIIAEAIEGLTDVLAENSNSVNIEFWSTVMATIGSIIAVVVFELIKEHFFAPRNEFKRLRRKVNSTLSMFACYYTNQIDIACSNEKEIEVYSSASKTMREMAVELMAFADDLKSESCCGITIDDISEASNLLMALSNRFFTPYRCPEMAENRVNSEIRKQIRELLGIKHE